MKTILVNGGTINDWEEPLKSIGFTNGPTISGNSRIYTREDMPYIGVIVSSYPSNTYVSGIGLYNNSNGTAFDDGFPINSGPSGGNRICYENLVNGGIIFSCCRQNSSPGPFVAVVPVNNLSLSDLYSGYVVCNALQTGSGAKPARVYLHSKSDGFDHTVDVLYFDNIVYNTLSEGNIQLVNAYNYKDDEIIDEIYVTVTNPFSYSAGTAGAYKEIQLDSNDKKYFIIPAFSGATNAKLAFEMADNS